MWNELRISWQYLVWVNHYFLIMASLAQSRLETTWISDHDKLPGTGVPRELMITEPNIKNHCVLLHQDTITRWCACNLPRCFHEILNSKVPRIFGWTLKLIGWTYKVQPIIPSRVQGLNCTIWSRGSRLPCTSLCRLIAPRADRAGDSSPVGAESATNEMERAYCRL